MAKVPVEDFGNWMADFAMSPHFKTLRFGQAFICKFHDQIHDMLPDPDLFYETDLVKSLEMINHKYIME